MAKPVDIPQVKLSNGYHMPMVGFGCFFGPMDDDNIKDSVYKSLESAIDVGYRHFDTAWLYGTEKLLAKAVKKKINAGVTTREEMFITSKLFWIFQLPADVKECVLDSLKNLGVDYIDMYLIHWPFAIKRPEDFNNMDCPYGDNVEMYKEHDYCKAWKVLEECVQSGLIRSIGLSNFNARQMLDILDCCTIKPVVNQCEVHPNYQNKQLHEVCQSEDVLMVGYTPFRRSNATVPAKPGITYPLQDSTLTDIAKKYGKTPGQIVLRSIIQRGIPVLPSSSNPQRQIENFSVFDFELKREDMDTIQHLDRNQKFWTLDYMKSHKDYPFHDPY